MKKQYLEAGKIVSTQGIRGELRVQPWCDSADFLCQFKQLYLHQGQDLLEVESARVHKTLAIIKFAQINSVNEADLYRGQVLYLDRSDCVLEEGRHFVQDLMGLTIEDAQTGHIYGVLTDVFKTGANDVYQVTSDEGKNYLIPVIPEVVKDVSIDKERILICPMKGIFDDED